MCFLWSKVFLDKGITNIVMPLYDIPSDTPHQPPAPASLSQPLYLSPLAGVCFVGPRSNSRC